MTPLGGTLSMVTWTHREYHQLHQGLQIPISSHQIRGDANSKRVLARISPYTSHAGQFPFQIGYCILTNINLCLDPFSYWTVGETHEENY